MPRPSGRDRLLGPELLLSVREPGGDHGGRGGAGDELPAVRAGAEEGGARRGEEDAGLFPLKGDFGISLPLFSEGIFVWGRRGCFSGVI